THCEQLPIKDNRVRQSNNVDDFGLRRPLISYRVDDDQRYVRDAFKKIIELHTKVFDELGAPTDTRVMQADAEGDALKYSGAGHIMGTTIMGTDHRRSVVDKDCRTHDHHNLYILGSSVFPTGSTANPTGTIAALALRAADTIKTRLRQRT